MPRRWGRDTTGRGWRSATLALDSPARGTRPVGRAYFTVIFWVDVYALQYQSSPG